jgi:hypothetical protein
MPHIKSSILMIALLQLWTFYGCLLPRTDNYSRTSFSLSYKPLMWHAGKCFNCCITADMVTWPFPTLVSSKYLYLLPGNKQGEAMCDLSRLGSARRKHRFGYCCVIVGACFDVTILAWRKYATVNFKTFVLTVGAYGCAMMWLFRKRENHLTVACIKN